MCVLVYLGIFVEKLDCVFVVIELLEFLIIDDFLFIGYFLMYIIEFNMWDGWWELESGLKIGKVFFEIVKE